MTNEFTQDEWDKLIVTYPAGTPMTGVVKNQQQYGVWVTLDELPEIPALLEIIHFEAIETTPNQKLTFPDSFPAVGKQISCRVLAWCEFPKDVRLTQLSHLDWSHERFLHEQEGDDV
ncbi:hypothetical protein AB1L30_11005 [Bremerella sp. JC817]|uniref:hypothetical protein n=1 Tax=Bremerella sp. JC817 TaxID=3231756 RepID=UPI003457DAD2